MASAMSPNRLPRRRELDVSSARAPRRMGPLLLAGSLLLGGLAGHVSTVLAAPPSHEDLEKLLRLGWASDAPSRTSGDLWFEQLAESTTRDSKVVYAQALCKIKQRRYPEAEKLIDELVALQPRNLDYAHAKVWLAVLLRKSDQALVVLQRMVAQLPTPANPASEEEPQTLETLRFAGRIHGYLEGPGAEASREATVAEQRKKLVDALTPSRKEAFLEGRDSVIDRWLGQKDDEQSTRDKATRDQEQQREDRLVQLEQQRQQDDQRTEQLNSERTRIRSELNDQMADFQRQERPLIDQFARLDSQAAVFRRELNLIVTDMDRLELLLARERDPILREQYLRELARLEAVGTRQRANLDTISRQGAGIAAQRAEIQRQSAQVQQQMNRQLASLDKEQGDIQRRMRSADGEERRLRKMPLGDTSQLRAMSAQSSAFTTYVAFALEEKRQHLLESARQP